MTSTQFHILHKLDTNNLKRNIQELLQDAQDLDNTLTKAAEERGKLHFPSEEKILYDQFPIFLKNMQLALKDPLNDLRAMSELVLQFLANTEPIPQRTKRGLVHSLFDFVFGSSVDSQTLDQLKDNIAVLAENQDSITSELDSQAQILNNTRNAISLNRDIMIQMDQNIRSLNGTVRSLVSTSRFLHRSLYEISESTHLGTHLTLILTRVNRVNQMLHQLTHCIRTLADHTLDPAIITPSELQSILTDLATNLQNHPELQLPIDPAADVNGYYALTRVDSLIFNQAIYLILIIPLVDRNSAADVYQPLALPLANSSLDIVYKYEFHGDNLVISQNKKYYAILPNSKTAACLANSGHFCQMNFPWLNLDQPRGCLPGLFLTIPQEKLTCHASLFPSYEVFPEYWDEELWTVPVTSPLRTVILCPDSPASEKVLQPPFALLHVPQNCRAVSSQFLLVTPYSRALNSTVKSSLFQSFTSMNWTNFAPLTELNLTPPASDSHSPIPRIVDQPIHLLSTHLKPINTNYPQNTLSWWQILIISASASVIFIGCLFVFLKMKLYRCCTGTSRPSPPSKRKLTTKDLTMVPQETIELQTISPPLPPNRVSITHVPLQAIAARQSAAADLDLSSTPTAPNNQRRRPATPASARQLLERYLDLSDYDRKRLELAHRRSGSTDRASSNRSSHKN